MDPLHKIDSAISVASKDNGIYEGQPIDDFPPDDYPPSSQGLARSSTSQKGGEQQSARGSESSIPVEDKTPAQAATGEVSYTRGESREQPQSTSSSASAPAPARAQTPVASAPASETASSTTPAVPARITPAMENLIQPLDVAKHETPPPYVEQPTAQWYQKPQLASPDTPRDASAAHSDADSSYSTPRTTATVDEGGDEYAHTKRDKEEGSSANEEREHGQDQYHSHQSTSQHERGYHQDDHRHQSQPSPAGVLDALTQSGTGAIDVDHDQLELESDAGYESDDRGSMASTSLSSSVRDYLFENGRRYHRFREGRYNFPNDEPEQDREDMKHACVKMLCQERLYFAPIDEDENGGKGPPQNILDIGTGTGIWAIEMGDQFPSANVLGIDLSPIQPEWVPANVQFLVDDAESEWVHPPDYFDYIHTRHTVMAIKDWPKLYRTTLEHLRPGGWVESQEIYHYPISSNNSMPPNHPVAQYWGLINEGLQRLGIDFHAAAGGKIATMMRDAGLVNVHERVFQVPLGTWPRHPDLKRVGEYWRHILLEGAQAIALGPLTRGCGWTREQVEVFLVDVRRAYFDNSSLMYMPMYVTYGQKPEY